MKTKRNKYRRWYAELMARAVNRKLEGYCERHHALPRSMGGGNEPTNIVQLTYREHFLAHWLLPKFTRGRDQKKMLHALNRMTHAHRSKRKIVISGWQYEVARRAAREAVKGNKNLLGYKHTPEARAKMSAAVKQSLRNPEVRAKISAARKGNKNALGHKHTPEHRAKNSAAQLGCNLAPWARAKLRAASPETLARLLAQTRNVRVATICEIIGAGQS